MMRLPFLPLFLSLLIAAVRAEAPAPLAPATPALGNLWDPSLLAYEPSPLAVEERTPTREQVNWRGRPRTMPVPAAEVSATKAPAKPLVVDQLRLTHLRFRDAHGEVVTALLAKPQRGDGPFPLVVAVHGLSSHKAQVVGQIAPMLAKRGFAVLAPDLPLHGERPGEPGEFVNRLNPTRQFQLFRQASIDVRQCIDMARQRPDLDAERVFLAGYSLGSFVSSITGPADERVAGMLLMVGGALDLPLALLQVPQVAALAPQCALPRFAPRPVLMLNARHDRIILPAMAERLFGAAREPKEIRWYDSGHLLPQNAYDEGAEWLAGLWKQLREKRESETETGPK